MVYCYYYLMPSDVLLQYDKFINQIPKQIRKKILKISRIEDRLRKISSWILMEKALLKWNINIRRTDLQIGKFGRPYIINSSGIDFNLSHSGNLIILAITSFGKVGIDVERIENIDLSEFKNVMSSDQWTSIYNSINPLARFYEFWTIKESSIKCDGRGLQIPLQLIEISNETTTWETISLFYTKLNIDINYSCHISSTRKIEHMQISHVDVLE